MRKVGEGDASLGQPFRDHRPPGKGGLARPWPSSSAKSFVQVAMCNGAVAGQTRTNYRRHADNTRPPQEASSKPVSERTCLPPGGLLEARFRAHVSAPGGLLEARFPAHVSAPRRLPLSPFPSARREARALKSRLLGPALARLGVSLCSGAQHSPLPPRLSPPRRPLVPSLPDPAGWLRLTCLALWGA